MARKRKKPSAKNAVKPEVPGPGRAWKPAYARHAIWFILAGSLILGIVCLLQYKSSPFFNHPIIDEADFVDWAYEIGGGDVLVPLGIKIAN